MAISATAIHISSSVSDGDVIAYSRCPVCFSCDERRKVGVIQKSPRIELLECLRCLAVSASHIPSDTFLRKYYEDYFPTLYAQYNRGRDIDVTFSDVARLSRHIAKNIDPKSFAGEDCVRILDFGGGDGSLSLSLASWLDVCVHVTVIDYGPNIAQIATDHVDITKSECIEDWSPDYDIVLASASLEHVPLLKPQLDRLLSCLKLGGLFYARTPFVVPLRRLSGGQVDFGYPAHIHDLGCRFWNRFVVRSPEEVELVSSRPSIVEVGPKEHLMRWFLSLLFKSIAHMEVLVFGTGWNPLWRLCGGWECVLQKIG